jgi:GNAT superfamily N-acetyltransferase
MLEFLKVGIEDLDECMMVKINAFSEDVRKYGFGPTGYDDMNVFREAITKYLMYKMVLDGKIVGGMSCCDKGNNEFWLGGIYIDEAHQNMGIGAKAISFLEEEFPQAKVWGLDTPYKSYRNHHFYEKVGYVKVGETEPDKDRGGFYLYIYEKKMSV